MANYTVKLPIQRDGRRYYIGEAIDLDQASFEELKGSLVIPESLPIPKLQVSQDALYDAVSAEKPEGLWAIPDPESIQVIAEPEPLAPFEESIDDVLSEPSNESNPPSVEAETQEEIPKATKRTRARS